MVKTYEFTVKVEYWNLNKNETFTFNNYGLVIRKLAQLLSKIGENKLKSVEIKPKVRVS